MLSRGLVGTAKLRLWQLNMGLVPHSFLFGTLLTDHIRESDCLINGLFHLKVQLNAELKDTNLNFFFRIIIIGWQRAIYVIS